MVQLFNTFGLVCGYFTCYGTVSIPSSLSWRLPLAFQAGIASFLAAASYLYLPHSPRWLTYKGRKEEAAAAWDALGVSSAEREKDVLQNPTTEGEAPLTNLPARSTAPVKVGFRETMRANIADYARIFHRDARKPMFLGVFMMAMQQLSGIDGIIFVRWTYH